MLNQTMYFDRSVYFQHTTVSKDAQVYDVILLSVQDGNCRRHIDVTVTPCIGVQC